MLAAQRKYDDYEEYDYYEAEEKKRHNRAKVIVVTRNSALQKFKAICAIFLILGLSLFIVQRCTYINERNTEVRKLKMELSTLEKENGQLEIQLERNVDLKQIEQVAIQKLGMQYPDKTQTVLLQVNKSDFTEVPQNLEEDTQNGIGVFQSIGQMLSQLMSYLY